LPVEVEVENLDELDAVLRPGVPRILLDNFTTYDIREAVSASTAAPTSRSRGGVTLERIPELATTGAQFVSIGALTHSAPAGRSQLRARAGGMSPDGIRRAPAPFAAIDDGWRRHRWRMTAPRHGVVVVAGEQTAGRGRVARSGRRRPARVCISPSSRADAHQSTTSLIDSRGRRWCSRRHRGGDRPCADLKWPNDLIVGTRKLAGILAERSCIGTPHQAVIIGVGINLQAGGVSAGCRGTCHVARRRAGTRDRGRCGPGQRAGSLVDRLALLERSPGDILQAWRAASPNAIGTRVEWDGRHGVTAGIDDSGAPAGEDHRSSRTHCRGRAPLDVVNMLLASMSGTRIS
jgi:biotin-(acetyl-CoA carboxylase) ligase